MVVRQAIMVGRSFFCAASIAAAIASGSCPSIREAYQPAAWKRSTWSVNSESDVEPSIVMWLSSKKTISFLSL